MLWIAKAMDFEFSDSTKREGASCCEVVYDDDDDDQYDNFYGAITQHMPLQGRLDKKLTACQRYDFSKAYIQRYIHTQ